MFLFSITLQDNGVYDLGNETVTSINGILDNQKVIRGATSTYNGIKTISKTYETADNAKEELLEYVIYLIEKEGYLVVKNDESTLEAAKESVDSGKIIYIIIQYTSNEYTVTVKKGEGTLNKY